MSIFKQNINLEKDSLNDAPPLSGFWGKRWLQALMIFLLSCVVYSNTITHEYAVDDAIVITRNQFTRLGMAGMEGIWTEDTFVGFFGKQQKLVTGGRYRPFSVATFALEIALWGDHPRNPQTGEYYKDAKGDFVKDKDGNYLYDGSPYMSHFINILLFGLLSVLIYYCVLQLLNPDKKDNNFKATFIAFVCALLYALHPIHTEAVANIKGRDEILVTLGGFLALHYTFKAFLVEGALRKTLCWVLGIAGFMMGVFSKESAIPFLAIIPAAFYVFLPRTRIGLVQIGLYTLPYVAFTLVFWFAIRSPILYVNLDGDEMGQILEKLSADMYKNHKTWFFWITNEPTEIMNNPFLKLENGAYRPFNDSQRMGTILYTWIYYLKLLAIPHPLTNDYYPRHIPVQEKDATFKWNIPDMGTDVSIVSLLLHLGLGFYGLWATYKRRAIGFAILFYAASFSVVSNLFFPIGTNMAERFMFMPSFGFTFAVALGLSTLLKFKPESLEIEETRLRQLTIGLAVVSLLYGVKTLHRNLAWYDDYTLFTTDIDISENSAKLNNAVSGVIQDKVNREPDPKVKEELLLKALKHSTKATTMHPTYNNAFLLLGNSNAMLANIYASRRDAANPAQDTAIAKKALAYYEAAAKAYIEVKRLRPDHPDAPLNLGVTYRDKGRLLGERLKNVGAAVQSLRNAAEILPNDPEVFRMLGITQGMAGLNNDAITSFLRSLDLNSNQAATWYNLGIAYASVGNQVESQKAYARAQALDPNYNTPTVNQPK
jgi:protein O-mannosyl-transferase